MKITFGTVRDDGYEKQFDILLDGEVIGEASMVDDFDTCEYCTSGLELGGGRYLEFVHEWGRNARVAQRDIRTELLLLLASERMGS